MPYDALCTVNQVKSWLKISGAGDDGGIGPMINAASELIGRWCERENLGNVYSYSENYSKRGRYNLDLNTGFDLVLRHWPIVSITSVSLGSTSYNLLTLAQLQAGAAGYYVEEDNEPRFLKFVGMNPVYPVNVQYTAGYAPGSVPFGLQQAAIQFCAELYRSEQWVMKKSVNVGGEVVAIDAGGTWGMSNRVQAMLQPYRDVNPFGMR